MVSFLALGCQKIERDITTTVSITIVAPQNIIMEKLQATINAVNINSRQSVISSAFTGNTITLELIKGAYQITIDGVIQYLNNGELITQRVRAYTDYCQFVDETGSMVMELSFL